MMPLIHVKLAKAENIVFLANMPLIDVHASGIFQFKRNHASQFSDLQHEDWIAVVFRGPQDEGWKVVAGF